MPAPARPADALFGPRPAIPDLGAHSIRGGAATFAATVTARLVQLASMLVLARLLTPADFGVFAVVMAFAGVAGLLYELGLASATVQRSALTPQQASTLFWVNAGCGAAITVAGLAAAPWLGRLYGDPRIALACQLLALRPLLGALGVQHLALLHRVMRFRTAAAIGLGSAAAGSGTAVVLAWQGLSFEALAIGTLVTSAVTTALCWRACPWRPGRPRFEPAAVEMLAFGGYLVGFGLLGAIGTSLHSMLLPFATGVESTGLYQRAYSTMQLLQGLTLGTVGAVAVAALSHLQDRPDEFRRYYLRCTGFLATLCAPLAAAGVLFGEPFMRLCFGDQWLASGPLFSILSLGLVFYALSFSTGWIYLATGRARRMSQWGLLGWTCVIAGTLAGLPFGLTGLAIAQTVTVALIFVPCMAMAFHGTPLTLGGLLGSIWRPVVAALLAGAATGLAGALLPDAPLPRLAAGALLLGATYGVLLSEVLGQRPQLLAFARELLGRRRAAAAP